MKDIELKVFIWASELYEGKTVYIASTTDMSGIGYIKVGEVDIKASVKEPDFTAVNKLKKDRAALAKSQKSELAWIDMMISEVGQ